MNKETFIQKYLHEELTDSEYQKFIALVESDPQFAENVQIESILFAQHKQNLKKEILAKSTLEDKENLVTFKEETESKTAMFHNLFPLIRNIAAVFILAFVSYYLFIDKSQEKQDLPSIVSSYLGDAHAPPPSLRGEETQKDDPWTIGIESYKLRKFNVAIEQIDKIQNRTNEQNLYLGLSRMYAPDRELNIVKAISDFESVLSSKNMHRSDEAQWFLSIAQILNDDQAKAKENLSQIISNNSWNAKKAAELLNKITD